ncbi:putative 60s Acidic ribosomal protein [Trypanosoma vivax]|uniref:Putative 60S acidic ribosomal protein P2 n=1 Tax=Trypanosoma vivax (strain Y486) TaxID=1055687 RepID=G0U5Y1_TRYVY|nr:putative 60S acidic ribosomal protein P2 [Trypanosoma vivax]CCC51281.1 putative 60S acidic ribosomal protein P2 [Trypanosoma vivax Y486]KAG8344053.1 putative 60S acidic ribosomal protein P2 [Trypanosoma vivax]KAH8607963.1 putative 60s Acidic ribosomal protein [Trypanosoma vivax]KAH8608166.1 putative 60s Acidic ribosomal protein [Trypanosoma vivax]
MAKAINPTDTLACTYAALMLSDAGAPITAENISAACNAAGLQVRSTLPILFARFLEKKPIETLLAAAAAVAPQAGADVAPAASAASGGAGAAAGGAAAGAGKESKKVEEEEDDDMGFGLFD